MKKKHYQHEKNITNTKKKIIDMKKDYQHKKNYDHEKNIYQYEKKLST